MPLSQAILLGDSLKKCDPDRWLAADGSCGCALGGGILAAGANDGSFDHGDSVGDNHTLQRLWPWLRESHINNITQMYFDVRFGFTTIERIADYVRSIEPQEQPDPQPETFTETVTRWLADSELEKK